LPTTDQRRHERIIAMQCDAFALADELLKISTVRKNAEIRRRVVGVRHAAREANILCCVEWFKDEFDKPAA
jgi:hypothetical protein